MNPADSVIARRRDLDPPCACPFCHSPLDQYLAAVGPQHAPRPGDCVVCMHCGTVGCVVSEGLITQVPARILRGWPTGRERLMLEVTLHAIVELRLLQLMWQGLRYGLYRRD